MLPATSSCDRLFGQEELARRRQLQSIILVLMANDDELAIAQDFAAGDRARESRGRPRRNRPAAIIQCVRHRMSAKWSYDCPLSDTHARSSTNGAANYMDSKGRGMKWPAQPARRNLECFQVWQERQPARLKGATSMPRSLSAWRTPRAI